MTRITFLTIVGSAALAVGSFAIAAPAALVAGKGAMPNVVIQVWVREVGVLILASGVLALLVRKHPDSPTMRAFLFSSALVHLGLLPIEIVAWSTGVLTQLSGILPNSVLHIVFAIGFLHYLRRIPVGS